MNERNSKKLYLTEHVKERMAKRHLSLPSLYFVVRHGQESRNGHCYLYTLRWEDIPNHLKGLRKYVRWAGVTVVLDGRAVVTAYRNPRHRYRQVQDRPKAYRQPAAFQSA